MTRTLVVTLLTLGDPGTLTGGYLYHRRMAELAPRHDAHVEFVSFPARPFPLPALAFPQVAAAVRRTHPDVVVLDSIAAAYYALGSVIKSPIGQPIEVPVVPILHQPPGGIDHGLLRTSIQAKLDRLAYRDAPLLLVASEHLADQLCDQGMDRGRIRVVLPGRDVAALSGPRVELRHGRRCAFLCVGNWVERKGIHDLLDAFSRLPEEAGMLHLAGNDEADPRYAARLWSRIREPDLAERVVVHGPVSRQAVATLYMSADVFVLASIREPYGTVYGEAMAHGLPVIGWRAGNLPYLSEDQREGLLVPAGDIQGLTDALARVAYDVSFRERLGDGATHRAGRLPTWEEVAASFFQILRDLVKPIQSDGVASVTSAAPAAEIAGFLSEYRLHDPHA